MKKNLLLTFALACFFHQSFSQSQQDYKFNLKKMLEVSGSEVTFKAVISQITTMYKQQAPQVPAEIWDELDSEFSRFALDDLVNLITPVYERHLTIEDIKSIIDFYNTPVGKKYAQKTPAITQESMVAGQQWGMQVAENLKERLKEKGY